MRNKNKLSVWQFCYRPSYYLTHPWKWLKDLRRCIRDFIHRGRYGFAYSDVWEWGSWWPMVGAEAMRYLAEHCEGYPAGDFESYEAYQAYLAGLAEQLQWCATSQEEFGTHHHGKVNEYKQAYDTICDERAIRLEGDADKEYTIFGTCNVTRYDLKSEDKDIIHQFWDREEELLKEDSQVRSDILAEIGQHLDRYWD